MKADTRIKAAMLGVAIIGVLAACGKEGAPPVAQAPATATAPAAAPVPVPTVVVSAGYVAPAAAAAGGRCVLDGLNGRKSKGAILATGSEVAFGGWVVAPDGTVPGDLVFVLKGEQQSYSAPFTAGGARPDVARAVSNDAATNSGFNLRAKLAGVAAGSYDLQIVAGGAAPFVCDLATSVSVSG